MEIKDFTQTILTWLQSAPAWAKISFTLILAALAIVILLASCGSTVRATVTNRAEGVTTTLSVTTNNPSTVNVNPNTDLKFNPK